MAVWHVDKLKYVVLTTRLYPSWMSIKDSSTQNRQYYIHMYLHRSRRLASSTATKLRDANYANFKEQLCIRPQTCYACNERHYGSSRHQRSSCCKGRTCGERSQSF
jgi:hypothetical protein